MFNQPIVCDLQLCKNDGVLTIDMCVIKAQRAASNAQACPQTMSIKYFCLTRTVEF